jgi:hypothetical protein
MPECGDAKLFQVLSREARRTRSLISFSRKTASYFPRPRPRSQTTTSITAPQTQGCRTSSCGPGRVSRRFRDGRFSVSIAATVKAVPRSLLTHPVPISARRNDRINCANTP